MRKRREIGMLYRYHSTFLENVILRDRREVQNPGSLYFLGASFYIASWIPHLRPCECRVSLKFAARPSRGMTTVFSLRFARIFYLTFFLSFTTLISSAHAFEWKDLWQRPDQQGMTLLEAKQPSQAAARFADPVWKGVAYYRAQNYRQAVKNFSKVNTALAHYDRGNALAQLGEYQAAIDAYEQALKLQPNFEDAVFNRDLLKKLLKQKSPPPPPPSQSNNNNSPPPPSPRSSPQPNPSGGSGQQSPSPSGGNNGNDPPQQNPQQNEGSPNKKPSPSEPSSDPVPSTQQPSSAQQASNADDDRLLQQIPDDPGGLLKQKFLRDYLKRHTE